MCVVVSLRSYTVRTWLQVHQQCTVKSLLLLSTLVLISLYIIIRKTWNGMNQTKMEGGTAALT